MAWEWVAPVAAAGGASIGAITTWLTARHGRVHAAELARLHSKQIERLAVDERQQKRFEEAYVELLQLVEGVGLWVQQKVRPSPGVNEDAVVPLSLAPDPPLLTGQARAHALAAAFATGEVAARLEDYYKAVAEVLRAEQWLIDAEAAKQRGEESQFDPEELWIEIVVQLKPKEIVRRSELVSQIRRDLQDAAADSDVSLYRG